MRYRLAVVVLNYRTAKLTVDCLQTLESEVEGGRDLVVVVENGSNDESVEVIEKAVADYGWHPWVKLVQSQFNVGFPAGCNIGIRSVEADAYLLLNNDTLVRPGAIASLLRAMQEHPGAGVISSGQEEPDGTPQTCCFRFRTPLSELVSVASSGPLTRFLKRHEVAIAPPYPPGKADWTCFASVLIRRQVVKEVGLLEEGYFLYFDDLDYCRRVWRAGWQVLHWPEARVVHIGGASNPLESSKAARRRKPRYYYESRARYFAKFYGRVGLWAANLLWMAGRAVSLARELVGRKQPHTCPREWLDNWTNWLHPFRPPTRWNGTPT